MQKPFLKWAGNKLPMIDRIKAVLPPGKRLIDPFVGGGAVFLNTHYDSYLLGDANRDLISVYWQLQNRTRWFIDRCELFFCDEYATEEVYYTLRQVFRSTRKPVLFPYLNRHGFHGLCRYNRDNGYNVPFGRYKKPKFPKQEMLNAAIKLNAPCVSTTELSVTLVTSDFEPLIDQAVKDDVVYLDPPYVPLSATSSFTAYQASGFGAQDQIRLAEAARRAQARGASVLVSNHNTEWTRQLYAGAEIITFGVKRQMAQDGNNRKEAPELLALFRGKA